MKKLTIVAALLIATTSAYAGNSISFEIGGQKVHIEAPRNCDALSCLQISAPGLSGSGFKSKRFDDNDNVAVNSDQPAPKLPPAPVVQAAAPAAPVTAPVAVPAVPASNASPTIVAATSPTPTIKSDAAPAAAPAAALAAPTTATAAPTTASAAPTTPVGIWATEDNKGSVRVEPCGDNLCGYAVKTGEKILINMKSAATKWTGRIHDPDSGRDYSSTITMKGPNALQVQGCAFGGLFCGGQTWTRVS